MPDIGEEFPDEIGIQAKGPIGVVHEANDGVQIGVDRMEQGATPREGVNVRHRLPRA